MVAFCIAYRMNWQTVIRFCRFFFKGWNNAYL